METDQQGGCQQNARNPEERQAAHEQFRIVFDRKVFIEKYTEDGFTVGMHDDISVALEEFISRAVAQAKVKYPFDPVLQDNLIKMTLLPVVEYMRNRMWQGVMGGPSGVSLDEINVVLKSADQLPASVLTLICKGNNHKITAIKELRSIRPNLGLAEAKKLVEEAGVKMGTMTVTKGGCFVATACYENYDHPVVMELRHFRDDCLETSTTGRAFVRWYYQWSPVFANIVAKRKILKVFARVLIVTPALTVARFIKKTQKD